jgi:hypothetical protein
MSNYNIAMSNPEHTLLWDFAQERPCPSCGSRNIIEDRLTHYTNVSCMECKRYLYSKVGNVEF